MKNTELNHLLDTTPVEQWPEGAKAVLMCVGAFHELHSAECVDSGGVVLSDRGLIEFQRLRASGYCPTLEQIADVIASNERTRRLAGVFSVGW